MRSILLKSDGYADRDILVGEVPFEPPATDKMPPVT